MIWSRSIHDGPANAIVRLSRFSRFAPVGCGPRRGDVEQRLYARDGADGLVGRQQLRVVQRARRKARGAVEADERHREGRERAEEGKVVGSARAPFGCGRESGVREQLTCVRDDPRVVLERRLARFEFDAGLASVRGGDRGRGLDDELAQRRPSWAWSATTTCAIARIGSRPWCG
jgi:hypothetical protein